MGSPRPTGQPGLAVVVNTGDDGDFYGLRVCPDLDICTYVLAGVADARGWGYADDSFRCLEGLATYGREAWFGLGDRDLATHIHRTLRLAEGAGLARVTGEICARLGVAARVLPMTEDPCAPASRPPPARAASRSTWCATAPPRRSSASSWSAPRGHRRRPGVLEAIAAAERIVICPSSPVVSIGTILAIAGVRAALAARRADCVAVSPIIGGRPVEGPADRFLRGAGYAECSATQMARIYADVAGAFVLDASDAAEAPAIAALGVRPVLADALMPDRPARARLAGAALEALA